jgi:hypothetical protein
MNFLLKKILKTTGLVIGSLLILMVIMSLVVNLFFKDKLIQYAINQINNKVNAKITIASSDFTFWKTFPNVSIEFKNVIVYSAVVGKTFESIKDYEINKLLTSSEVYFEFSIIKLLKNNYVLKQIQINNGNLLLANFSDGKSNFDILKKSSRKTPGPDIQLNSIVLKNCSIQFFHSNAKLKISGFTEKTTIRGIIKPNNLNFKIQGGFFIDNLSVRNINYLMDKEVSIESNIHISNGTLYTFKESEFSVDKVPFAFQGTYLSSGCNKVNLTVTANKQKINELVRILPYQFSSKLKGYTLKGNCNLLFTINGCTSENEFPVMKLALNVSKGMVQENESKIQLSNLELDCIYSNGELKSRSGYVRINKCSSRMGIGSFSLNGTISNLFQPKVNLNVLTELNLNELKNFLRLDTFEILEGGITGKLSVTGLIPKLGNLKISDTRLLNYKGDIDIKAAKVKLKGLDYLVHDIYGKIQIDNDLYFNNLSLSLHDNPIQINGKMINGLSYFFRLSNETFLDATISSNKLDLSKYFVKGEVLNNTSYSREVLFPANISFNVKLDINEFILNKFNAKWVKGELSYSPGMFIIKSASFESCDGKVAGNGSIVQDAGNNFVVKGISNINRVNIHSLFYTFNNFAQRVVRDEHLNGKISGNINFSSVWNSKLEFRPGLFVIDADVTVYNGELVNFQPLYGLSKFIALDELKNIKFSTLHNTIYVKDKQIIIPQMEIQSSAFNITGSGSHSFDNHYKYKIRVLLSDILYRKAKSAKKENEEYGQVEDDGLGHTTIPLKIEGIGTDYKILYDPKSTIQIVKESLTKQKSELKEIFREEFGWFKKDTAKSIKKHSKQVQVEWEDSILNKPKNAVNKQNKKKDSEQKVKVEFE